MEREHAHRVLEILGFIENLARANDGRIRSENNTVWKIPRYCLRLFASQANNVIFRRFARELGFVNRVLPAGDLERETFDYARRVAEQSQYALRMAKLAVNKMQDAQGYSSSVEAAFADYLVAANPRGSTPEDRRVPGVRRLGGVDLALRGERGERPGLSG